jgi:inorganic pyrophosphatase
VVPNLQNPRWKARGEYNELFHLLEQRLIQQNVFAFSGEAKSKKYAVEIIHECHEAWKKLISADGASKAEAHSIHT